MHYLLFRKTLPLTAGIYFSLSLFPEIVRSEALDPKSLETPNLSELAVPAKLETCTYSAEKVEPFEQSLGSLMVTGKSSLRSSEIAEAVKPFQDQALIPEVLQQAADAITLLYLNQGYITSRAIPTKDKTNEISIIEGYIEKIEIENRNRLRLGYLCKRILLGIDRPLNKNKLDDQLRLLKSDPLLKNLEANLKAGSALGASILTVRVSEASAFNFSLGSDNFSPVTIGSERFGGTIGYQNLMGGGDGLSLTHYRSTTGGSTSWDISYRIPINPMNGSFLFRYAPNKSKITQKPFDEARIRANNKLFEASYRQPVIRTPREELAFSLAFGLQDGQNFIFDDLPLAPPFGIGAEEDGSTHTRVLRFGQEYIRRDLSGAWGLRSQFNFGLDIFDATQNPSPTPDGEFFAWVGQIQRVQRINNSHLLILQGDVSLASTPLLPIQQYVLGGGQSLRGYRQNLTTGDNGFRVSIEDRIVVVRDKTGLPKFQIAPFIDVGKSWNASSNNIPTKTNKVLVGLGLGAIWEPSPGLLFRIDYAAPLAKIPDRGNNLQDTSIYFSLGYTP
jgi:hemolysin activation/secretion protein